MKDMEKRERGSKCMNKNELRREKRYKKHVNYVHKDFIN
jgi:hypothetical protein